MAIIFDNKIATLEEEDLEISKIPRKCKLTILTTLIIPVSMTDHE